MNNLLITSAPQPSGNVASTSQQDAASGAGDQASLPFAQVLARKIDKTADSDANTGDETSNLDVASPAQDQAVVPVDALNAILSQIPVEMRGPNVADRMTQLAAGGHTTANLDPASLNMASAPLAAGTAIPASTETKGSSPFAGELSEQVSAPSPQAGANQSAADKPNDLLVTSEQLLLSDALRQNAPNRSDLASTPIQISAATAATMIGTPAGNLVTAAPQTISTPLTSPAWGEDFSQKISWMVSQKNQVAELHLNPPNLGPLDVVLKISDNQATALFASPHAAVRDAVENALPKLRELLADNGIMLSNATVGDQSPRDRGAGEFASGKEGASSGRASADVATETSGALPTSSARRHSGMVDTFA